MQVQVSIQAAKAVAARIELARRLEKWRTPTIIKIALKIFFKKNAQEIKKS